MAFFAEDPPNTDRSQTDIDKDIFISDSHIMATIRTGSAETNL